MFHASLFAVVPYPLSLTRPRPPPPPPPSQTPTTQVISPFSHRTSCKPPEYTAGSKRHQTSIIEHRRRKDYTYDFVESALLLKQLMYVTIRETFETQSSQRGLYSGILTWFLQYEASSSQDATFPVIIVETSTDYFTLCLSSLISKTFIPKRTHETSTKKKTTTTIVGRNTSTRRTTQFILCFRSVSANYDRDCSQGLPVQCITGSYINTWMKREKAKQHSQGIKATSRHSNLQKGVFAPPSLFRVPLARDLSRDPLRPLEES